MTGFWCAYHGSRIAARVLARGGVSMMFRGNPFGGLALIVFLPVGVLLGAFLGYRLGVEDDGGQE